MYSVAHICFNISMTITSNRYPKGDQNISMVHWSQRDQGQEEDNVFHKLLKAVGQ